MSLQIELWSVPFLSMKMIRSAATKNQQNCHPSNKTSSLVAEKVEAVEAALEERTTMPGVCDCVVVVGEKEPEFPDSEMAISF
jgi:hypothetical protein